MTRSFDRDHMEWSYEMHLQALFSAQDVAGLPFGSVFGSVPAHSTSKRHTHQDGEMFFILAGEAVVVLGDEERVLRQGDALYLTPFSFHEIRNESDVPFDLVSVYWDDPRAADEALRELPAHGRFAARTRVFCPPPTPNGGLHLGHLAGPYVRADMLVRGLRSMGHQARYITGTDDHQSFVAASARVEGVAPDRIASRHGDAILATLASAGVRPDRVTRPATDPGHPETTGEWWARLTASPAVGRRTEATAWCEPCGLSLFQAFAVGTCRLCGASSNGEICEACARPNQARDLEGPACRVCGTPAVMREETGLWLDLGALAEGVREHLTASEVSPDLRDVAERLLNAPEGVAPYRLTRTGDWGAPCDEPDQRLDPWADLVFTFLEAARQEELQDPEPATTVLFLGLDNGYFYTVLLPALALATGAGHLLPSVYITNQFLHLDGAKFSTSRGHAVWADDVLDGEDADAVRAALLRAAPEGRIVSIPREIAGNCTSDPLITVAHEWLSGFAGLRERHGAAVPGTGAWTVAHREFYRYLGAATENLNGLLLPGSFSARGYVRALDELLARALEFRETEGPLRRVASLAEETRTSLALEYLAAKVFAGLSTPVIPTLAARVHGWLGLEGEPVREVNWAFVPSGTVPESPSPLAPPVSASLNEENL